MIRIVLTTLAAAFLIGLTACSGSNEGDMEAQKTFDPEAAMALLVTDIDPACGMEVTADVLHDTTTYETKVYGFCSASCKETFGKDPATLVAALPVEDEHGGEHEGHEGQEHDN